jgi:hypothetical protein
VRVEAAVRPEAVEAEEPIASTVSAGALAAAAAAAAPAAQPAPAVVAAPPIEAKPVQVEALVPPPPAVEEKRAVAAAPAAEEKRAVAAAPAVEEKPVVAAAPGAIATASALDPVSLTEPPLPQRYEVDEVVAIAVDPRTIYVYWEVRPTTLAHARAAQPGGSLHLRIASVTASWEGPQSETRDLLVDSLYGDRFIRDIRPGSLIRVSVGWMSDAGFEPLAVGDELSAPRMLPVDVLTHDVVRWEPTPVAPFMSPRVEPEEAMARFEEGSLAAPFPHADRPALLHEGTGHDVVEAPAGMHGFAFEQRVATSRLEAEGRGGPVDTGVASWRSAVFVGGALPREEIYDEVVAEGPWLVPGGASELARGLRRSRVRRLIPGAPGQVHFAPFAPPGASELARGGASEQSRNPPG